MFARPPVGKAKISPQTKHLTSVDGCENIICSFLHLLHRTLTKKLLGSLNILSPHTNSILFVLLPADWVTVFPQFGQVNLKSVFFDCFLLYLFQLDKAPLEYLPWFPAPLLRPRAIALCLEPLFKELRSRLLALLTVITT